MPSVPGSVLIRSLVLCLCAAVLLAAPAAEPVRLQIPTAGLRVDADSLGIAIADDGGTPICRLRLQGLSRPGGAPEPLASAHAARLVSHIQIWRRGIDEVLMATDDGLRHGLVLSALPAGTGPILLDIALDGCTPVAGQEAVILHGPGGSLRWTLQDAHDLYGNRVPLGWRLQADARLQVRIDTAGLAPPLRIYGLFTRHAASPASDAAGEAALVHCD